MVKAYYNEIEPFAAEWLRNLIKAGEIAPGDVDERDIRDVTPAELMGYEQCHFFAGIGGWSRALRLAGWLDDRPVWTGSCPCQSFSTAGRYGGFADERHLWPVWFHLIRVCKPPVIFGEQVASKLALSWLDLVQDDLASEGYACGAADLCAASVGAPHIRQRLWFVADSMRDGTERTTGNQNFATQEAQRKGQDERETRTSIKFGVSSPPLKQSSESLDILADAGSGPSLGRPHESGREAQGGTAFGGSGQDDHPRLLADATGFRCPCPGDHITGSPREAIKERGRQGNPPDDYGVVSERCQDEVNPYADLYWLPCRDGKWRPTGFVEPSFLGMADGLSDLLGLCRSEGEEKAYISPLVKKTFSRVGRLRGYGNAIVPGVAAEFIKACMEGYK